MKYIEFEDRYGIFSKKDIQWIYIPTDNKDSIVIEYFNKRRLIIIFETDDECNEFFHNLSLLIKHASPKDERVELVTVSHDNIKEFYMEDTP